MSYFGTDDWQEPVSINELAALILKSKRKQAADADEKPVAVYTFVRDPVTGILRLEGEEPFAFLKRVQRTTVKPNPSAIQEALDKLGSNGIIDLYSERMEQAEKGQTQTLKGAELESVESLKAAVENPDVLDLYSARILKRRR